MREWVSRVGSMAVMAAVRTPKASASVFSELWVGASIGIGVCGRGRLHNQDE